MKIKNVRVYGRDLGTSRPYTIAYKTVSEVIIAFVEIELENGIIGIGASNSSKVVVGESVDETLNHLRDVDFSYLIGQKITQTEGLLRQTHDKFTTLPEPMRPLILPSMMHLLNFSKSLWLIILDSNKRRYPPQSPLESKI